MEKWQGQADYVPARGTGFELGAKPITLVVNAASEGISFFYQDKLHFYPWDNLKVFSSSASVEIKSMGGESFTLTIRDSDLAAHWRKGIPFTKGARYIPWLVGSGIAALLLCLGLIVWGVFAMPKLMDRLVKNLPYKWENELGEQLIRQYPQDKLMSGANTLQAQIKIDSIMKLLPNSDSIQFKIHWINDTAVSNAFALPGGHIMVYSGLLGDLKGQDELIPILFHEAGHAIHRHGMRQMASAASGRFIFYTIFGDLGGLGGIFANQGEWLLMQRYSRDAEREADAYAVKSLEAFGWNSEGMVRFFSRMSEKEPKAGVWSIMSTHPPSKERLKQISNIKPSTKKTVDVLSAEEWGQLKKKERL